MNGRLIVSIISTIAEEAAILIIGVWLLPKAGIHLHILVIPGIMLIWLWWSVFTYRKGTLALINTPVKGFVSMKGMKGTVVKTLQPDGLIKIRGELWKGHSISGRIETGTDVIVIGQEGLRLLVSLDNRHLTTSLTINDGHNDEGNTNHG
jgi:membrane-bound ClpP family serine protease